MSYTHITLNDRITLATLLRCGKKQKEIAEKLEKDPRSISRDLKYEDILNFHLLL